MKKSSVCIIGMLVFVGLMIYRFSRKDYLASWIDFSVGMNFIVGYIILLELEAHKKT